MADDNCVLPPRILRLATDPPNHRRTSIPRVTLCTGETSYQNSNNHVSRPRSSNNSARSLSEQWQQSSSSASSRSRYDESASQSSPRVVVVPALCTSIVDPLGPDLPPLFFPSMPIEETGTGTTGFLSPGQAMTTRSCRTLAVLLRLRVSQIVLGIVTLVLGASACLDPKARETLAFGVPAGSLTLLAATGHVRSVRKEGPSGLQQRSCPHLGVLCLAVVAAVANMFLLVLSLLSAGSGSQNQRSLGVLLTCATLPVLLVEAAASMVRWAWASHKWAA
ncbi:unnamed protein product [Ixodes hexagonus]